MTIKKPASTSAKTTAPNLAPDFFRRGFSPEDAAILAMRTSLLWELRDKLAACGWSIDETAERLGVTRGIVDHLEHGHWQCFNCDMLLTLAERAERHLQSRAAE
jgi:predicted XRE-type DNA-binding protein